jgi:hypothetical protein
MKRIEKENEKRMYKVIGKTVTFDVVTLDEAMHTAKTMNEFVTIKGKDFEVCGVFGVDSVKDGVCPDGVSYDWNKKDRIGRVKKEYEYIKS